jgi:hypothetical protein
MHVDDNERSGWVAELPAIENRSNFASSLLQMREAPFRVESTQF